VPASDPRLDYYTGAPDQTDSGGAPSILPGYGPNTRTIMQIRVAGSGGPGGVDYVDPIMLANLQTALPAAFGASQEPIIVPQNAYDPVYGTNTVDTAGRNFATIQATSMTFAPIGQADLTVDLQPKSIIEDFQIDYGRMNAILGVEIPHTNNTNQTSIPQMYIDPPTEIVKITDNPDAVLIGQAADGTQIWKITHNGVDTHAIHFHLYHVQLVNRVGWDGAVRMPDANEVGWKDTVRMNPLEDVIVALRPRELLNLPFQVVNSVRPLDPTRPLGSVAQFTGVDPLGNPVTVVNDLINYGWEYVWHCHLLGHEENDMMRAQAIAEPPYDPTGLTAVLQGNGANRRAVLNWTDNSVNETGFTIQRSTTPDPSFNPTATFTVGPGVTTYSDTIGNTNQTYYYRVFATNTVGATQGSGFTAPAGVLTGGGGPSAYTTLIAESGYSNTTGVNLPPDAVPSNVNVTGATLTQGRARFTITWTQTSTNETGFRVQWATNAAFTTGVGSTTVGANVTTAQTPGTGNARLLQNTDYYFRVQAYNNFGTSAWVNFGGATPTPTRVP
jgi:hypothetical protein